MRTAACSCGQLAVTVDGDPIRVSMCHCLACQRRTGSPFAVQARWSLERATIAGRATEYVRTGDEGGQATFRFCPTCGDTVYWINHAMADQLAIPVGMFGEPTFPPPTTSIYRIRKHPWVSWTAPIEEYD